MKQNAKSAIFTCENGKRLLRQLLLLLPAWIVLALGIAMCVFSGVGSDTNTSFQQGLGRMLGLHCFGFWCRRRKLIHLKRH